MRLKFLLCLISLCISPALFSQGVLLGDEPGQAHPSAILDIRSDEKGLLIPSMTTAERDAIPDPFDGLIVYNITIGHLNVYDSVEDEWQILEPLRDPPPPPEPAIPATQTMVLTAAHFGPGSLGGGARYAAEDFFDSSVYNETLLSYVSAPLFLPVGTVLSSITVHYRDNVLLEDMTIGLSAQLVGSNNPLSFINSYNTGNGFPSAALQSVTLNIGHTLLPNRGYAISAENAESVDLSIQAVIVNYTLPTN